MYSSISSNVLNFLGKNLRPMRRFYGAYLLNKSAILIFKILIDCSFLRDDFENRFLKII